MFVKLLLRPERYQILKGLMWSERKHGLSTEQFPVSAYAGSSKNLKDLKMPRSWYRGGLAHKNNHPP